MGFPKSQARPFGDNFLCFCKTNDYLQPQGNSQIPRIWRTSPDGTIKLANIFSAGVSLFGGNVRDETTGSMQSVCVCNKNTESEMESPGERRRKSQQAKINKSIKLTKLCDRFSSRWTQISQRWIMNVAATTRRVVCFRRPTAKEWPLKQQQRVDREWLAFSLYVCTTCVNLEGATIRHHYKRDLKININNTK